MPLSSTTKKKVALLGAHTSAAGGPDKALEEGKAIGATMIQFFTANQRQWHPKPLTEEAVKNFERARQESPIQELMSHSSYLINLGSPDEGNLMKSRKAFREEIQRCQALGVDYLNFHPGAALQGSREACLERIIESLLEMKPLLEEGKVRLLVETTAGQGSVVGSTFEEIGVLVKACAGQLPFGVCIDTCHIFAGGYDIRTAAGWEAVLDLFEKEVGLTHLYAFHLNDSLKGLGEHKDRHAPLGEGQIGRECFKYLMQSPRTAHLPMCLETPGGPPLWEKEIQLLRSFRT